MVLKIKRSFLLSLFLLLVVGLAGFLIYRSDKVQKTLYPTGYSEIVYRYAEEYEVDPLLLFAIIKTESDFDPNATSNVGARGLMQMMEETFHWINTKIKNDKVSYSDMYKPEENIQYGAFLISYLLTEFQDIEASVTAYHAGRGAVNGWLKDRSYSADGKALHEIPSSDTAHYVDKVMKHYKIYQRLYGNT